MNYKIQFFNIIYYYRKNKNDEVKRKEFEEWLKKECDKRGITNADNSFEPVTSNSLLTETPNQFKEWLESEKRWIEHEKKYKGIK